jgi:hypothetical protein
MHGYIDTANLCYQGKSRRAYFTLSKFAKNTRIGSGTPSGLSVTSLGVAVLCGMRPPCLRARHRGEAIATILKSGCFLLHRIQAVARKQKAPIRQPYAAPRCTGCLCIAWWRGPRLAQASGSRAIILPQPANVMKNLVVFFWLAWPALPGYQKPVQNACKQSSSCVAVGSGCKVSCYETVPSILGHGNGFHVVFLPS